MHQKRKVAGFIINPKFQFSLLIFFLVLYFLVIGVFYIAFGVCFEGLLSISPEMGHQGQKVLSGAISDQQDKFNQIFIYASLFTFFLITFAWIFISHRIAGPIFRMEKFLNHHKEKEHYTELKFRKGDFFLELADQFNDYQKHCKKVTPVSWLNEDGSEH